MFITMKLVMALFLLSLFFLSSAHAANESKEEFIAKKRSSLIISGLSQVRFTNINTESSSSLNNFDLALGKLAFSGNVLHPNVDYLIQLEASTFHNNNNVSFSDWWIQYTFSYALSVKIGRFLLPYSRQYFTYPGNLLFIDLSSADFAFNLPRALGVVASGTVNKISYYICALNCIRALDSQGEANRVGGELSILGRVEIDILNPYGYIESRPVVVERPELSIGVAFARNEIDYATTIQNLNVGDKTTNITLDAGFRFKGLAFQAAYYYRINKPKNLSISSYNDFGFYLQSGYQLVPKRFEIVGRYSVIDFNDLPASIEATGGFNYYLRGHNLKIQADYSLIYKRSVISPDSKKDYRLRIQAQLHF